ncbi:MAG: aminodeoxychorismate synthase component I [Dehalococcoidales bacterium]
MALAPRHPLIEEIETGLAPPSLFGLFRDDPFCFFLDSGMDHHKLGRYSFIGSRPFLVLRTRGRRAELIDDGGTTVLDDSDPFDLLRRLLDQYRLEPASLPVPFPGGAVGYLSYDLCHFVERLPKTAVDDLELPECYFGFYDRVVAIDNLEGKTWLVSTGFPELEESAWAARAAERLAELKDKIEAAVAPSDPPVAVPAAVGLSGGFTHESYLAAVDRARDYIIAGDIFEVNLSQRFEAELAVSPWELYRRLRQINPAPFASYLDFDGVTIVGASPERFLRTRGDRVETRPIKGTRPRGRAPEEDDASASELLASAKDRAENVMIVDLERNDLGRVCRYGSVKVTELAALEVFPTVFHLTSTVEGRLRANRDRFDLLRAAFPGGSITGAPKVRAMEIIDELEPTRRGVYTGSIGYLGFDGNMDLNIAIRGFVVRNGRAYFQVGGAVVYDSDPESEYRETLDKARALFDALNAPAAIER